MITLGLSWFLLEPKVVPAHGAFLYVFTPPLGAKAGYATDPLLFQAGSTEMLLSHSRKAFELARAAGTHAELQEWPQMPHVWQPVHWLPEARRALACVGDFVSRHRGAHP